MGLQIISIIGNATKDAEMKTSKDGVSYLTFRVGVSGSGANPTSTFYNVLVFGKYGEIIQEHVTKGRQIYVSGRVQISEKGYISVIADYVELLARPKTKVKVEEREEMTASEKESKSQ